MPAKEPIAKAKALPAGAVFHRCALQVNPHHYGAAFRGQSADGDASAHAQAIVEKAVEIGVSVLAITDHNDVSDVPAFRNAARDAACMSSQDSSCLRARVSTFCASTLKTLPTISSSAISVSLGSGIHRPLPTWPTSHSSRSSSRFASSTG